MCLKLADSIFSNTRQRIPPHLLFLQQREEFIFTVDKYIYESVLAEPSTKLFGYKNYKSGTKQTNDKHSLQGMIWYSVLFSVELFYFLQKYIYLAYFYSNLRKQMVVELNNFFLSLPLLFFNIRKKYNDDKLFIIYSSL